MTPERAKELLPIITAYADGKTIQYRYVVGMGEWLDLEDNLAFKGSGEYRIKPETLKYRRYLFLYAGLNIMSCATEGSTPPEQFERTSNFVRWIDTEWQEVEV